MKYMSIVVFIWHYIRAIVAEKQKLRDLTDIANGKTPDELLLILKQLEGDK